MLQLAFTQLARQLSVYGKIFGHNKSLDALISVDNLHNYLL